MKKHILLINTKAYREGTGPRAIKLARTARRLSRRARAEIWLSVQAVDIPAVSRIVPTLSQHIDAIQPGAFTGHVLPEAIKAAKARGTLINHSERRLDLHEIRKRVERAREARLVSVVCAPYTVMVSRIAPMNPDFIAIEPPELIGTGVSVSQSKPYVITRSVELTKKKNPRTRVLCGAGISTGEDVAKALELGTVGVLVASSIVKSRNPEKPIKEILKGFG